MTPQYLIERLKFEAQGTHGDVPLFHLKSMQRQSPPYGDGARRSLCGFRHEAEPVYPADILEMFRFLEGSDDK
jgi:hypothetical protein